MEVRNFAIWQRSLLLNMDSPVNRFVELVLGENRDAAQVRDKYAIHDLSCKDN